MIQAALADLLDGRDLGRERAREVMSEIMQGEATQAQIGGFLVALRLKGETAAEIAGCAEAMREHVLPVRPTRDDLVDTAGTGGDGARTINISTAAAIVAAAAGAGVAKHGNRAVSSASGSADVLEALGFELELPPERIASSIDELGFGFMFAPAHHPAMRHAAPVRRELAARTVFNVLGPLTNPAGARAQVIGVYARPLVRTIAEVLAQPQEAIAQDIRVPDVGRQQREERDHRGPPPRPRRRCDSGGELAIVLRQRAQDQSGGELTALAQMAALYEEYENSVLGVMPVATNETDQYGIVDVVELAQRVHKVTRIVEKPKPADAPSTLGVVGRYILTPKIFKHLQNVAPGAGGEIQLTDGIAGLLTEEQVLAYRFDGIRYDCGSKSGYLEATVKLGLRHPECGKEFRAMLENMFGGKHALREQADKSHENQPELLVVGGKK